MRKCCDCERGCGETTYLCTERCATCSAGSRVRIGCTSARRRPPCTDTGRTCGCMFCQRSRSSGSRKLCKCKRNRWIEMFVWERLIIVFAPNWTPHWFTLIAKIHQMHAILPSQQTSVQMNSQRFQKNTSEFMSVPKMECHHNYRTVRAKTPAGWRMRMFDAQVNELSAKKYPTIYGPILRMNIASLKRPTYEDKKTHCKTVPNS